MPNEQQDPAVGLYASTERTNLYAGPRFNTNPGPFENMDSNTEASEMTTEEVLDKHTEQPETEVKILPVWEENPEERPGENLRLEENALFWERDGFTARLESHETTHWRAEIDIPEYVGKWFPRDLDVKCLPVPEYGFVENVDIADYETTRVTIVIQENFQPTWDVNNFLDELKDGAIGSEEFMNDLDEKLESARDKLE